MGHRSVIVGGLILTAAVLGGTLWTVLDKKANLPRGQNLGTAKENAERAADRDDPHPPPRVDRGYYPINPAVNREYYPIDPALQKLQWLADESRCRVSDNPALMAGCVRERIAKVRAKALAYKERYESLRDLDRVYFENLHKEGLIPMTIHIKPDAVANGLEQGLR